MYPGADRATPARLRLSINWRTRHRLICWPWVAVGVATLTACGMAAAMVLTVPVAPPAGPTRTVAMNQTEMVPVGTYIEQTGFVALISAYVRQRLDIAEDKGHWPDGWRLRCVQHALTWCTRWYMSQDYEIEDGGVLTTGGINNEDCCTEIAICMLIDRTLSCPFPHWPGTEPVGSYTIAERFRTSMEPLTRSIWPRGKAELFEHAWIPDLAISQLGKRRPQCMTDAQAKEWETSVTAAIEREDAIRRDPEYSLSRALGHLKSTLDALKALTERLNRRQERIMDGKVRAEPLGEWREWLTLAENASEGMGSILLARELIAHGALDRLCVMRGDRTGERRLNLMVSLAHLRPHLAAISRIAFGTGNDVSHAIEGAMLETDEVRRAAVEMNAVAWLGPMPSMGEQATVSVTTPPITAPNPLATSNGSDYRDAEWIRYFSEEGISPGALRQMIRRGKIVSYRQEDDGERYLYSVREIAEVKPDYAALLLDALIENRAVPATARKRTKPDKGAHKRTKPDR